MPPATEPAGKTGGPADRRAPILARSETALQARGFREEMQRLGDQLEPLDPQDRRYVYSLVRWLGSNWIGLHGPSHRTLIAHVASIEGGLAVAVHTDPPLDDHRFWSELIADSPPDLFETWSRDRRGPAGLWFELRRNR